MTGQTSLVFLPRGRSVEKLISRKQQRKTAVAQILFTLFLRTELISTSPLLSIPDNMGHPNHFNARTDKAAPSFLLAKYAVLRANETSAKPPNVHCHFEAKSLRSGCSALSNGTLMKMGGLADAEKGHRLISW